jgi:hypothetical protein
MLFYRNLSEAMMLKGQERPPMLVRDGAYWKLAPARAMDSDFFAWFISDQLDEALNPGQFLDFMRDGMRGIATEVGGERGRAARRCQWRAPLAKLVSE